MSRVTRTIAVAACCVIFSLIQVRVATAGPFTYARADSTSAIVGPAGESDSEEFPGTLGASASANSDMVGETPGYGNLTTTGTASATAEPGYLGAFANADVQSTWAGTLTVHIDNLAGSSSSAHARFVIDDVIISTSLPGVTTIPVSMYLEIGGSLGADASTNGDFGTGFAYSGGTATVTVGANIAGAAFAGSRNHIINNTQIEGTTSATGLLAGGDLFSTPTAVVPVNAPFQVELSLQVNAGASTSLSHGNATATASYGNTFSFATRGPVFDLPAGYTANSLSGRIVDNRFAIPEPASLGLALLGAAPAWLSRRFAW